MRKPSTWVQGTALAGVALALAGCGASGAGDGADQGGGTGAPSAGSASSGGSDYRDGTYSATGSYDTPGGTQSIEVQATLAGGTVTALTVTPQATDQTAQRYQQQFASGVADQVVGKTLDEADVQIVSGSSLTHTGFEAALEQIREESRG